MSLSKICSRNSSTKAAIARLRAYKPPPFPTWDRLPVSRRAAVLILLFGDRRGDLRVVITMRAASLRNFSGRLNTLFFLIYIYIYIYLFTRAISLIALFNTLLTSPFEGINEANPSNEQAMPLFPVGKRIPSVKHLVSLFTDMGRNTLLFCPFQILRIFHDKGNGHSRMISWREKAHRRPSHRLKIWHWKRNGDPQ